MQSKSKTVLRYTQSRAKHVSHPLSLAQLQNNSRYYHLKTSKYVASCNYCASSFNHVHVTTSQIFWIPYILIFLFVDGRLLWECYGTSRTKWIIWNQQLPVSRVYEMRLENSSRKNRGIRLSYSGTPHLRPPPPKSDWGGLKRGVVSREGFATFNTRGRLQ